MRPFQLLIKLVSVYLSLYLSLVPVMLHAAGKFSGTVAVLTFQNLTTEENLKNLGEVISEGISTRLASQGVIEVVERSRLDKLLDEKQLETTGLIDEKTAAEFGKMVGAKVVVIGSCSKAGSDVVINARAVDAESARIIAASSQKGNGNNVSAVAHRVADELQYKLSGIQVSVKKPFYKKVWFWGLVAVAGGGAAAGLGGGGGEKAQPLPEFPEPPK